MYPDGNLWRCGIAGGVNPKQETKAKPLPSKSLHAAGGICKLSLARNFQKHGPCLRSLFVIADVTHPPQAIVGLAHITSFHDDNYEFASSLYQQRKP